MRCELQVTRRKQSSLLWSLYFSIHFEWDWPRWEERDLGEPSRGCMKVLSGILLGIFMKTPMLLSQDSQCPGRDSKWVLPAYKVYNDTTTPDFSVEELRKTTINELRSRNSNAAPSKHESGVSTAQCTPDWISYGLPQSTQSNARKAPRSVTPDRH
jgi:hypothetical protein